MRLLLLTILLLLLPALSPAEATPGDPRLLISRMESKTMNVLSYRARTTIIEKLPEGDATTVIERFFVRNIGANLEYRDATRTVHAKDGKQVGQPIRILGVMNEKEEWTEVSKAKVKRATRKPRLFQPSVLYYDEIRNLAATGTPSLQPPDNVGDQFCNVIQIDFPGGKAPTRIYLRESDGLEVKREDTDKDGNPRITTTEYLETNGGIDREVFNYFPPPDAKIIDIPSPPPTETSYQ